MRRTSFIYVVSSVLVIAATAFAAPPADVRPNDQPFVPSGGYLKAAQELQLQRRAAIANRNLAEAARSTMRGRRQIPVILLEFSEGGHPYDAAKYQALLFDDVTNSAPASTRPTLTHYYYDISNHNLLVTGQTFGWYKLPKKDTYYENGHNGTGKPFGDLLEFALTKADADTDFGQFDNDGPDG